MARTTDGIPLRPAWLVTDCVMRLQAGRLWGCGFMVKPQLGWNFREDRRPHYSAVLVLRGSGTYWDEHGRAWPLQPGSLLQRFSGRPHSHHITEDGQWAECWTLMPAEIEDRLAEFGIADPRRPVLQTGIDRTLVDDLMRLREGLRDCPDGLLPRRLWALAEWVMAVMEPALTPPRSPHDRAIAAARRRIGRDPDVPVAQLAAATGLSPERFRHVFRAVTGSTLAAVRARSRLDLALALLQDPEIPVAEIGRRVGFSDPTSFSAFFRQATGRSPRSYRAARQG